MISYGGTIGHSCGGGLSKQGLNTCNGFVSSRSTACGCRRSLRHFAEEIGTHVAGRDRVGDISKGGTAFALGRLAATETAYSEKRKKSPYGDTWK